MKVIHEKTIYQLIFFPLLFPVNCYLIEEIDSLTLIDAALPFSYKGILSMSDKLEKPITRIVLTHVHEDHVGALDALKELLPNATIYVSERDSRLMGGDISLDKDEPDMPIRGSIPKKLNTRADVLLKEGDQISSLIALSTPGHTPGSFSYLDTRNDALIVGDAFQTRGGIAVGGQVMPLFPFPAMATWNQDIALASAKKLLKYEPTLLATGHGKMIKDPQVAMNLAIDAAEQNLIRALQKRSK